MIIARAALLVVSATSVVRADARPAGPLPVAKDAADPAVQDAAEANLESTESRRGFTFAASLGGGLIVGFGIDGSVGRGGSLSLRVGHVATRRTVITFELEACAALHKAATMGETLTNTDVNLFAGGQYYVNRSLWLRVAGGVGVYTRRDKQLVAGQVTTVNTTFAGPAALGGLGIELLRFKSAALGVEAGTSAMINRDGVVISTGLGLDVSFD